MEEKERFDCYDCAIIMGQSAIGSETGFINPNVRVGQLSPFEWGKLANSVVSGWIVERSRQMVNDRWNEPEFLAMGQTPEPFALGAVAVLLPPLADWIETKGLSDLPIGQWSKPDILHFLWLTLELQKDSKTARDERPGPVEGVDFLMAG